LLGFVIGIIGFVIAAYFLARYLPKVEFLSGLILNPSVPKKDKDAEISKTSPPEESGRLLKAGDRGIVLSTLRPAGKAGFGQAVVDVVAEGDFIDKGSEVEIIEISGNRVVVGKYKK
jgi:membrane-bound serine protease (ClpP class)